VAVPEALRQPVDGYDLAVPYQRWRGWVESQKGPAIERLLAEPEQVEGERSVGPPLLRFLKRNDFGHFLTGEIRVYCLAAEPRAFIPHDVAGSDGENPVSAWARQAFDPAKLVPHLRASGLGPDSDWWRVDPARMFEVLPSPAQVLADNLALVRLDSRHCPEMERALRALEGQSLGALDLPTVGRDGYGEPPAPHAIRVTYEIQSVTPGGGYRIEGSGRLMDELVAPVLAAADACEAARD
jgi:hypothetical protein